MQDFPLHFQLHIVSRFFTGWGVLMGFCLIICWHNKNNMRMGEEYRSLWDGPGNRRRGWERSRLLAMPPHFLLHYDPNLDFFFLKEYTLWLHGARRRLSALADRDTFICRVVQP